VTLASFSIQGFALSENEISVLHHDTVSDTNHPLYLPKNTFCIFELYELEER